MTAPADRAALAELVTAEDRWYRYAASGFPVGYWPEQYARDAALLAAPPYRKDATEPPKEAP